MRKFGLPAALMAFTMLASVGTANAQMATVLKTVQIGVAVGGAIPLSDLGTSFNTGFNLTGAVGVNPAGLPVGFRIDAAYNQFGAKSTGTSNAKIAGVSGNVVLSMAGAGIAPYLIGGVGYYRVSSSADGLGLPAQVRAGFIGSASNRLALNAGAGLHIPLTGFTTFIEARYNWISASVGKSPSFVPLTVGVMF